MLLRIDIPSPTRRAWSDRPIRDGGGRRPSLSGWVLRSSVGTDDGPEYHQSQSGTGPTNTVLQCTPAYSSKITGDLPNDSPLKLKLKSDEVILRTVQVGIDPRPGLRTMGNIHLESPMVPSPMVHKKEDEGERGRRMDGGRVIVKWRRRRRLSNHSPFPLHGRMV